MTIKKQCNTCSIRFHDGFCMKRCIYVNDEDTCESWSNNKLSFNCKRIYDLCNTYIDLYKTYKEMQAYYKKRPDDETKVFIEDNYNFFIKCCLNDLHREMSLWQTKR